MNPTSNFECAYLYRLIYIDGTPIIKSINPSYGSEYVIYRKNYFNRIPYDEDSIICPCGQIFCPYRKKMLTDNGTYAFCLNSFDSYEFYRNE